MCVQSRGQMLVLFLKYSYFFFLRWGSLTTLEWLQQAKLAGNGALGTCCLCFPGSGFTRTELRPSCLQTKRFTACASLLTPVVLVGPAFMCEAHPSPRQQFLPLIIFINELKKWSSLSKGGNIFIMEKQDYCRLKYDYLWLQSWSTYLG